MTDSSSGDVVQRLFTAFARRDIAAAAEFITDDFEFFPQGTADRVGRTEPYVGREGLEQYQRDVDAEWDELIVDPGDLRVAANGVVAFGTVRGVVGGVEHVLPVIWVFKLRDGRAASVRVVRTAAEATAELSAARGADAQSS